MSGTENENHRELPNEVLVYVEEQDTENNFLTTATEMEDMSVGTEVGVYKLVRKGILSKKVTTRLKKIPARKVQK